MSSFIACQRLSTVSKKIEPRTDRPRASFRLVDARSALLHGCSYTMRWLSLKLCILSLSSGLSDSSSLRMWSSWIERSPHGAALGSICTWLLSSSPSLLLGGNGPYFWSSCSSCRFESRLRRCTRCWLTFARYRCRSQSLWCSPLALTARRLKHGLLRYVHRSSGGTSLLVAAALSSSDADRGGLLDADMALVVGEELLNANWIRWS